MIITIGGTAGSGKTSVAFAIAKKLGYTYFGAGEIRRRYALDHGMTLEQLNELSESDPKSDHFADECMRTLAEREDNLVVDGRVAFFFIPKSIKVFIDATLDIRAARVMKDCRVEEKISCLADAKASLDKRQVSDEKRYKTLYGINAFDMSNYDLVIDSTNKVIDEVAGEIYRFVMFKSNCINKKE